MPKTGAATPRIMLCRIVVSRGWQWKVFSIGFEALSRGSGLCARRSEQEKALSFGGERIDLQKGTIQRSAEEKHITKEGPRTRGHFRILPGNLSGCVTKGVREATKDEP